MATDLKYGEVTTERGQFEPDEPVVLFRGRDRLLPKMLKIYRLLCELAGSPDHHLDAIHQSAERVKAWQAANPSLVRTPSSDAYRQRRVAEAAQAE
jgi:hypothetical protein